MLEISEQLATQILNSRNDSGRCDFGYMCDQGAVVGDSEFIVNQEDGGKYFLVHKSELEEDGIFVRIKQRKS